jgi:hypothetical protein
MAESVKWAVPEFSEVSEGYSGGWRMEPGSVSVAGQSSGNEPGTTRDRRGGSGGVVEDVELGSGGIGDEGLGSGRVEDVGVVGASEGALRADVNKDETRDREGILPKWTREVKEFLLSEGNEGIESESGNKS